MSELKPCPNPECISHKTGELPVCIGDELPDELFIVKCLACELSGPVATSAATAETRWNALPSEERWVPVREGLPPPVSGQLFEVCVYDPNLHGVFGGSFLGFAARTDGLWCMRWPHPSSVIYDNDDNDRRLVTHYRPFEHTPPRGPEEA